MTRRLAEASGIRLAVRGRPGPEAGEVVVAFPWRRRGSAEALGREVAEVMSALLTTRRSPQRLIAEAAGRIDAVEPGPEPTVPAPHIPVVSVTGTNGKTTTVRLLAHIVRTAGRSVAYSSTDGVYRNDELVEPGDYSGFAGAAMALAQEPDVAVLETARGGILLRGIGVQHNDVAVVTNVSADHLDLQGIHTLDQLAEVKATITRITRPDGWDVLNADDPRVLSMRRGSSGRVWLFSLDHDHPAIRAVLAEGGRAMTVLDGRMTVLERSIARPLVRLEDVPMTIAGISSANIQNAMAAAAAALGIGLPERAVARGLRSFVLDPEANPGRANLFMLDEPGGRGGLRPQRGRDDGADRDLPRPAPAGARGMDGDLHRRATAGRTSCTPSPIGPRGEPTTSRWPSYRGICAGTTPRTSWNASGPARSTAAPPTSRSSPTRCTRWSGWSKARARATWWPSPPWASGRRSSPGWKSERPTPGAGGGAPAGALGARLHVADDPVRLGPSRAAGVAAYRRT